MDQREYSELCTRLEGKVAEFSVNFMELGILLEAIRLMLDHPDVQEMSWPYHEMVRLLRETLLEAYAGLGLTTTQIHELDTMYASESDGYTIGVDRAAPGTRDRSHLRLVDYQVGEDV